MEGEGADQDIRGVFLKISSLEHFASFFYCMLCSAFFSRGSEGGGVGDCEFSIRACLHPICFTRGERKKLSVNKDFKKATKGVRF